MARKKNFSDITICGVQQRIDDSTVELRAQENGDEVTVVADLKELRRPSLKEKIRGVSVGTVISFNAAQGQGTARVTLSQSGKLEADSIDSNDKFVLELPSSKNAEAYLYEQQRDGSFEEFPLGQITDFTIE